MYLDNQHEKRDFLALLVILAALVLGGIVAGCRQSPSGDGPEDAPQVAEPAPSGAEGVRTMSGTPDTTHFTNIRFFEEVADYEAMIGREGYAQHINGLAEHLRPHEDAPGKYFADVVISDWPGEPVPPPGPDPAGPG